MNIPVVRSNPFNIKSPLVNVYVPVAVNAYALLIVTVPADCMNAGNALNVPPV